MVRHGQRSEHAAQPGKTSADPLISKDDWGSVFDRMRLDDIRRVRVAWADQHGVSRTKVITSRAFPKVCSEGLRCNLGTLLSDSSGRTVMDPFATDRGLHRPEFAGAPDLLLFPDPSTFRVLPWAPQTGWVIADLAATTGEPLSFSSRAQLRTAVDLASQSDVRPAVGIELEFHLMRAADRASTGPVESIGAYAVRPTHTGYQHQSEAALDNVSDFLDILQDHLEQLDLPVRTLEVECGPSQFEISLDVLGAMEAADAAFLLKNAAKMIARRHGYHITFMARPASPGFSSSGWHLHLSMTDGLGVNLFVPEDDRELLSRHGRHFVGGIMRNAREAALLTVPTITGYKRLQPHSLAPDRVTWAADNRGAMIRVTGDRSLGSTHIENRVGDPAANGYLYIASQILTGLDGITRAEEPPPPAKAPYEEDSPRLPSTLPEAISAFEASELFLKTMGEDFVTFYAAHKRSEAARFAASELGRTTEPHQVSDWEQFEYFDLY